VLEAQEVEILLNSNCFSSVLLRESRRSDGGIVVSFSADEDLPKKGALIFYD